MIIFKKAHPATRTMIGGDPTPEQAMAGDYPKLRREWRGLPIAIEHPEGTVREGIDETGKPWRTVFRYAYGEILGTLGMDGDPVDVFIGSYADAPEVYIVQQMKRKQWDVADEQKVMIDFASVDEARQAYLEHYDDPRFFGGITAMPVDEFIAKVRATATNGKPAMIKSILFFKGFIGPYLRGGKMVNLKGYHSKQTKRVTASEGQSSLFADLAPPPEVKQTAKVARALTTWMQRHGGPAGMARLLADMSPEHQEKLVDAMAAIGKTDAATVRGMLGPGGTAAPAPGEPDLFSEPQHTEPTRELIEEHERLVDVLNSPSHEDDKVEAKRQAEELAEMKQEAAAAPVPTKAQQTRARRKAVLDVLGEGWKADAGVDGAKDKYSKVFPKSEGGKLEVTIMPEKTVDGNFYVGSYHRGGTRRGAGSNGYAQTIEEAKAMADRFAGVSTETKPAKAAQQDLVDHIKYLGGERKKDLLELAAHIDDFGYSNSVPDNVHIPVKNAAAAINHITRTSRISTEHGLAARKLTGAKARKVLADVAAAGGLGSIQDHIDAFQRIMGGSTMTKSIVLLRKPS